MSDLSRVMTVKAAKHSSTTTYATADVGTAYFLDFDSCDAMPRDTDRIERNLGSGDNMEFASIRGAKKLDPIGMTIAARGVSGNTGTAAFASATTTELGQLLDCVIGAATDPSGAGEAATGGTGSSSQLTFTAGTNYAGGGGVLFANTGGQVFARQIVSGGGTTTVTLDRGFTGTAAAANVVRGARYTLSSSTSMHTHLQLDAEGSNWRRVYDGCMSGLDIDFAEGQPVKFNFSWLPTDWTDSAEANGAYSAATAGSYIVNLGGLFYIGDEAFLLKDAKLSLGYTIVPRVATSGTNGVYGYVVTRKAPVLTGKLYVGTNETFGELSDSGTTPDLNTFQGLDQNPGEVISTKDISLQVGSGGATTAATAGTRTMYVRIPAAEFSGKFANDNGLEVFEFSARATRPASGNMLDLFLF